MIVVMTPNAAETDLNHVVEMVERMGLKSHIIRGTDRTVVAAVGDKRMVDKGALENTPGVEKIVPILAPYKVASTEVKREKTLVHFQPAGPAIGAPGRARHCRRPCSVEDREGLLDLAESVKAARCRCDSRRGVQAAYQSLQLPGSGREGPGISGRSSRNARGLAVVHRGADCQSRGTGGPSMPMFCRSVPATCRITCCSMPWGSRASPYCSSVP